MVSVVSTRAATRHIVGGGPKELAFMNETIRNFIEAADELLTLQQQLIGPHQTQPTIQATKAYTLARQALLDLRMNASTKEAAD
jgi:hypothetical protein